MPVKRYQTAFFSWKEQTNMLEKCVDLGFAFARDVSIMRQRVMCKQGKFLFT